MKKLQLASLTLAALLLAGLLNLGRSETAGGLHGRNRSCRHRGPGGNPGPRCRAAGRRIHR